MNAPANDNRPPEFDARVMAYRPGLFNLAGKLGARGEERVDLVTDTIIEALEKWQNFREDGGFYNWLYWTMRGRLTNQRKRKTLNVCEMTEEVVEINSCIDPPQYDYMALSDTIRCLPRGRNGSVLLRRAMGETLQVIGDDLGIGKERVRQIEQNSRASVMAATGRANVA